MAPTERSDVEVTPHELPVSSSRGETDVGGSPISVTREAGATIAAETTLRLIGTVPPEIWNRIGIKLIPKLRSATDLTVSIDIAATCPSSLSGNFATELRRILDELGIGNTVQIK